MSIQQEAESTVDDILYHGWRDLRDIGKGDPDVSLERDAMRELGLLDGLEVADHQVRTTIYEDGRVVLDLQIRD